MNSSTLKRTLRENNRYLAKALELKKTELRILQNQQMKLRAENQSLQQELTKLRACANMQSIADFEREVKRRVDVSVYKLLQKLRAVSSVFCVLYVRYFSWLSAYAFLLLFIVGIRWSLPFSCLNIAVTFCAHLHKSSLQMVLCGSTWRVNQIVISYN